MTKFATVLLGVSLLCYSCQEKAEVSNQYIYSTLNAIIQQDTFFAQTVCSKYDPVALPDSILNEYFYFSHDKDFIKEQMLQAANTSIERDSIYFYSSQLKELKKADITSTCSNGGLVARFSYPLFSADLKTVVLKVTEGEEGFTAVYQQKDNKWLQVKNYNTWIQ